MKRVRILIAAAIAAGGPGASWACGACIEDKVAATYDHAVIKAAIARHHQVVFVAVDGPVSAAKVNARVAATATRVRGVQAGTLRTSLTPPAFSFALDATESPEGAVSGFRKVVADPAARLTLVRIMADGVLREPE